MPRVPCTAHGAAQVCADFTMRRVVPADVGRVPPDDCPESWGRREEWLAQVREVRLRERRGGLGARPAPPRAQAAAEGGGLGGAMGQFLMAVAILFALWYSA
jgi:hypothetical protein